MFQIKHIRGILVEESDVVDKDDDDIVEKSSLSVTKVPKVTKLISPKPKLLNGTKLFSQSKNLQLGDDAQLVVVLKNAVKNETDGSQPPRQRLLLNRAAKNRWPIDSGNVSGEMAKSICEDTKTMPITFSCDIDKSTQERKNVS